MAPYMSGHPGVHVHLDVVDSMGLNMRERSRASGPFGRAVFGLQVSLVGRYEARVAREADSVSGGGSSSTARNPASRMPG